MRVNLFSRFPLSLCDFATTIRASDKQNHCPYVGRQSRRHVGTLTSFTIDESAFFHSHCPLSGDLCRSRLRDLNITFVRLGFLVMSVFRFRALTRSYDQLLHVWKDSAHSPASSSAYCMQSASTTFRQGMTKLSDFASVCRSPRLSNGSLSSMYAPAAERCSTTTWCICLY